MPRITYLGDLGAGTTSLLSDDAGTLTISTAAWPFLLKPDALWRTLPGESGYAWPSYNPSTSPREERAGREANFHRERKASIEHGNNVYTWVIVNDSGYGPGDTFAAYVERALSKGHRFMINTTGVEGWSIWEKASIDGFVYVIQKWLTLLDTDIAYLKTLPKKFAPARMQAEALKLELQAARGALGAFSRTLGKLMMYDRDHTAMMHASEAADWFAGAVGLAQSSQHVLDNAGQSVSDGLQGTVATRLIANAAGIDAQFFAGLATTAESAIKPFITSLRNQVITLVENALGQVGIKIASEASAAAASDIVPVLGQIVVAAIGAIQAAFHLGEGDPPSVKTWARGNIVYTRTHLDTYATLMYRAMILHSRRMRGAHVGSITWDPGSSIPQMTVHVTFPSTGVPKVVAPSPTTGAISTPVLVGGGVALAGLVWWALRRKR